MSRLSSTNSDAVTKIELNFRDHGAERFADAAKADLALLDDALACLPTYAVGTRIFGLERLRPLLDPASAIGSVAAGVLGPAIRPVRAILFDKSPTMNWSLGWHQDRTICVRARVETDGFGPWTLKAGMHHVEPPMELLARMVTVRVHLDDVSAANAPLLIAPKSHRLGRVPEAAIARVVSRCGTQICLAQAGDVWLYATPILHASRPASFPARRRVLQVDFAAEDLPNRLEWLGI